MKTTKTMKTSNDTSTNPAITHDRGEFDPPGTRERKAWRKFQKQAEARAQTLEAEAMATRLVALAEDPEDMVSFLLDLSAYTVSTQARELARSHGDAEPPAYVPASKLLTRFDQLLDEKLSTIANLLELTERQRLESSTPGFLKAVEANDPLVQSIVLRLISMPAEDADLWIRQNLDGIEARFTP